MTTTTVEQVIGWLAAEPAGAGVFLDFDGTLTDIVDDPTVVRLPAEVRPLLAAVAASVGVLAIVSGRPAPFLADRADVPGARLLGLYGLQEWRDGALWERPEAASWRPRVDEARTELSADLAGAAGVMVEDKGLSVAVHWRNAPDRAATAARVAALVARLADRTGLAREPGKLVEELRPPVAWDKGAGVRAVAREAGLRRSVYAGDDLGDLSAFAAVRSLGGYALAVDHGAETPAALRDAADLVVDGPDAVTAFLSGLRTALGA